MAGARPKAFDTEPRLEEIREPILMLGMQISTGMKSVYRDVAGLGKRWKRFKRIGSVPNPREPWAFVAVSKNHDPSSQRWNYLMGDVVTRVGAIPSGLVSYAIPAGMYAVFTLRPPNRFAWGRTIGSAKRYIYTEWLPRSGLESSPELSDFELHDKRSTPRRGASIELYVAVRKKSA